jgi:hypothetical protein
MLAQRVWGWRCPTTKRGRAGGKVDGGCRTCGCTTATVDVQTIGDVPATQTAGVVGVGVCKERTYRRLVSPSSRLIRSVVHAPYMLAKLPCLPVFVACKVWVT